MSFTLKLKNNNYFSIIMADADIEDIRRVLRVCFRDGMSLSEIDIERILSFDMGWLSPVEAETAVKALIDSGWLIQDSESLKPAIEDNEISTPLGWFPRPSRLISPVVFDSSMFSNALAIETQNNPAIIQPLASEVPNKVVENIESKDPRARLENRLKKFVAKKSKISVEEIDRRTQRKKQALGMVSEWMCLALVAREQGLAMNQIVDALK